MVTEPRASLLQAVDRVLTKVWTVVTSGLALKQHRWSTYLCIDGHILEMEAAEELGHSLKTREDTLINRYFVKQEVW